MRLDDGAVDRHRFDLDAHDLSNLQLLENRKRGANTVLTGRRFQAASASGVSI
jgi:hypothetical protein